MKKLILLVAIVLLIPISSWGQDEYGSADFSRRDAFTRDDLVACWNFLTPGVGQAIGSNYFDGYFGPFKIGKYSATWPLYVWDRRPVKKPY